MEVGVPWLGQKKVGDSRLRRRELGGSRLGRNDLSGFKQQSKYGSVPGGPVLRLDQGNERHGCQFFKMIGGALTYNWGCPMQWHTLKNYLPSFFFFSPLCHFVLEIGEKVRNTTPSRILEVNGI